MTLLFQDRVLPWMLETFGAAVSMDRVERNHRFLEEALELVQSLGCSKSEAHQLVDYVFDRPQGDINQEVGGVMVTLAALCIAADECMHEAGETELARIWTKVDEIRAKQAAKPKHSPLPGRAPECSGPPCYCALMERPKGDCDAAKAEFAGMFGLTSTAPLLDGPLLPLATCSRADEGAGA